MDAKQLSTLKQVAADAAKPVVVHDLKEICKQKILVNKITMEFLKTQVQMSTLTKQLQDYSIQNATEKMQLVSKLIGLYEKQCAEYSSGRQNECLELYSQLNEINNPPPDIAAIIRNLDNLDNKVRDLSNRIDYFSKRIPNEQIGTQYVIKKGGPTSSSCSDDLD